jgi:signal transduction histidine kinase
VFAEFIHPDDRPRLYAHMKELAAQPHLPAQDLEYRLKRPEGGWRHVHARGIVTRDAQGRAVRILGLLTDVSVARALAESIRTSEKMDALGLVTGSVAHDFNNVLAAMSSGAQLLMHDAPPGPARDAARRIYDAALKGAAVTRQLLSFTRKSEFRLTPIDLAALLARNKPILERVVGPEIVVVTEATGDCSVVADTGRIDQLLLILALNAQEAMGGRGTLRISARPVELSSLELAATLEGRPGRMVEIAVEDSGHGMTPAVIERAFEPYFTTRQARGASGLGLAIVLSTVRQHEGHIKIESTLGRGTTVRVYLPRDTGG